MGLGAVGALGAEGDIMLGNDGITPVVGEVTRDGVEVRRMPR